LKAELKAMNVAKKSNDNDSLKLKLAILRVTNKMPKTVDELYNMLEKELGASVAQLRETYDNFDNIVKELVMEYIDIKRNLI